MSQKKATTKKPTVRVKKSAAKKATVMSSLAIQAVLKKKVTDKQLTYEFDRFIDMTDKQLKTRIGKMTNPVKLEACRQIAKDLGKVALVRLARARRNECFNG